MRKYLLAVVVAGALAVAAPAAAHPAYGYVGGCRLDAVRDETEPAGTRWRAAVHALVVATSDTGPTTVRTTVECHLYLDGAFSRVLLTSSGAGHASGTATGFILHAPRGSVLTVCGTVTVSADEHFSCAPATTVAIVP